MDSLCGNYHKVQIVMRWYRHFSRLNEGRIPKEVLNMKMKGKCPKRRHRWEEHVRKDVTKEKVIT
jgi:hypothetical protein